MYCDVKALLTSSEIQCRLLDASEAEAVRSRWLSTFAANVLKQKGVEVFQGYMWHGFSFGMEVSLEGEAAQQEYQKQFQAEYVLFDEDFNFCLACEPSAYPDLTELMDDLYVTHANMKWTMVFTHEQPGIGPFFASGAMR